MSANIPYEFSIYTGLKPCIKFGPTESIDTVLNYCKIRQLYTLQLSVKAAEDLSLHEDGSGLTAATTSRGAQGPTDRCTGSQ